LTTEHEAPPDNGDKKDEPVSGGVFATAAPAFAKHGVATIPVKGKKPAVGNWGEKTKYTVRTSLKHADNPKFADANVGVLCGKRSGISVVDVDTTDDRELQWVLDTFGASPVIERTGVGKFHVYYRHAGEGRRIRAFKNCGHGEIDLLGSSGFFVAAPSIHPDTGKPYIFETGSMDDFNRLPFMNADALADLLPATKAKREKADATTGEITDGAAEPSAETVEVPAGMVGEGERNGALFKYALRTAWEVSSFESLLRMLLAMNPEMCSPPLPEGQAAEIARTVWDYKEAGTLVRPGSQSLLYDVDTFMSLLSGDHMDAIGLFGFLRVAHAGKRQVFAASPAALRKAGHIGSWSEKRYRAAIADLLALGLIERVHSGGNGPRDPHTFSFTQPTH
jgi:hypothetical protein